MPAISPSRPSRGWYAVPAVLLVAALVLAVWTVWYAVSSFAGTDGEVPMDGAEHRVELSGTDTRLVWAAPDVAPAVLGVCTVTDATSGEPIDLRPPGASYTRDFGTTQQGAATFEPTSGEVAVRCRHPGPAATATPVVEIAPAPDFSSLFTAIMLGILGAIVLGLAALTVLVVLLVKRSHR